MKFQPRIEVKLFKDLSTLKPGQYISMCGAKGRYMGSSKHADWVLWKNTGSNFHSNRFRKLAKRYSN